MIKDFDSWNTQKKRIHTAGKNKFYHPRDIWWCNLGVNIGFEQDGTDENCSRPVVIVRGFGKQICFVVPLTASKKEHKHRVKLGIIGGREASAIISQVRVIDTKRLVNKIGVLSEEIFKTIKKAVRELT